MNNSDIKHIIIHCAATPNGKPFDVKDIDQWHKERSFRRADEFVKKHDKELTQTWNYHLISDGYLEKPKPKAAPKHCGYHYVIKTDGVIQLGRHLDENGAHARGWNSRSVGICLIGTDRFTRHQWDSLAVLIRMLLKHALSRGWGPNGVQIIGHREVNPHKTCPGFDVAKWVEEARVSEPAPKPWPDDALYETQQGIDDPS